MPAEWVLWLLQGCVTSWIGPLSAAIQMLQRSSIPQTNRFESTIFWSGFRILNRTCVFVYNSNYSVCTNLGISDF